MFGRLDHRFDRDGRDDSWRRPPRSCAGGPVGRVPCGRCGARPHRASFPAGRDRGSTGPSAPAPGRRPGRRPRHDDGRPGAGGRRAKPSARAGPPARQGDFAGGIAAVVEPLEELAVGQSGDGIAIEQRTELADERGCSPSRHAVRPPSGSRSFADPMRRSFIPTSTTARMPAFFSRVVRKKESVIIHGNTAELDLR